MDFNALILIVDDDPNFREIFNAQLKAAGFRVATAPDGERGFTQAKILKPDLIISDMKMPHMAGCEMIEKLKSDPETKNIKVILLSSLATGQDQAVDDHYASWIGALGYLSKSEDLNVLVDKIKKYLAA